MKSRREMPSFMAAMVRGKAVELSSLAPPGVVPLLEGAAHRADVRMLHVWRCVGSVADPPSAEHTVRKDSAQCAVNARRATFLHVAGALRTVRRLRGPDERTRRAGL